jgi:PAS domain S-box-containing protein
MKTRIKLLLIEDSETDAFLIVREIEKSGFDVEYKRIETAKELQQFLNDVQWDVIISDFNIPGFGGIEALELVQATRKDIPFILLSGTIGEETAVNVMKAGANDYLMKSNLTKLAPVVKREIEEAGIRKERRMLKKAINDISNRVSRTFGKEYLTEITNQLAATLNADYAFIGLVNKYEPLKIDTLTFSERGIIKGNKSFHLTGTPCVEVLKNNKSLCIDSAYKKFPLDPDLSEKRIEAFIGIPLTDKSNNVIGLVKALFKQPLQNSTIIETIIQLFSDRISTEIERMQVAEMITESNLLMRQAQSLAKLGNWQWDIKNNKLEWSDELYKIYGVVKEKFDATFEGYLTLLHSDDRERIKHLIEDSLINKRQVHFEERIVRPDSSAVRFLKSWASVVTDEKGNVQKMIGACLDVTENKKATELIEMSELRFRSLLHNIADIITLLNENGEILYKSASVAHVLGYDPEELVGKNIFDFVHPDETELTTALFHKALLQDGNTSTIQVRFLNKNGEYRIMEAQGNNQLHNPAIKALVINSRDVTERVETAAALDKSKEELVQEKILKQQEITEAVIISQEKERNEIGSELHDNVCQLLSTARMYMRLAKSEINISNDQLDEADNLLQSSIEEIRNLSHRLIPVPLVQDKLIAALDNICDTTEIFKADEIQIERGFAEFDESILPDKLKVAIFRIVQEQLNNILKHAYCSVITVSLQQYGNTVELSVKDNGVGFNQAASKNGIGLLNIQTRASFFNGQLYINTAPNRGCEIIVRFDKTNFGINQPDREMEKMS